jgi:hypothetical protein
MASTTTATASASSTSPAAKIIVTTTVTGQKGQPAPKGIVDLLGSGQKLGAFTLKPEIDDISTATLALDSQNLLQGTNLLTFQYEGDAYYQPSSYNLTLNNPTDEFSMVALTPVITVANGHTATGTVSVTNINPSNLSVALGATAPFALTWTLNPPSVAANQSTLVNLTVQPTATGDFSLVVSGYRGSLLHYATITVHSR